MLRTSVVVIALLASACATTEPTNAADASSTAAPTIRIIVKVRDARALEATTRDLQRQARDAGGTIAYMRPSHGNVHLYELTGADAATVARLLQRFGAHTNVEYAEPERVLRHQSPRLQEH